MKLEIQLDKDRGEKHKCQAFFVDQHMQAGVTRQRAHGEDDESSL